MEPLEFYLVVLTFAENDLTTIAEIAKSRLSTPCLLPVYSCLAMSSHVYLCLVMSTQVYSLSTPCLLPVYSCLLNTQK